MFKKIKWFPYKFYCIDHWTFISETEGFVSLKQLTSEIFMGRRQQIGDSFEILIGKMK